ELLTRGIDVDLECLRRCPRLLPFLVQLLRFEFGHRDSTTIVPSRPRREMRDAFAGFERADVGRSYGEIIGLVENQKKGPDASRPAQSSHPQSLQIRTRSGHPSSPAAGTRRRRTGSSARGSSPASAYPDSQ